VWTSTEKEIDMNHHFIYHLARERQAEFLREAEMERMARKGITRKPIAARWKPSFVPALIFVIMILMEFLG
jgi:hypothetical protein